MFHPNTTLGKLIRSLTLLLGLCMSLQAVAQDQQKLIRIGLRAHLGTQAALKQWGPTADYLSRQLPGHHFVMVPYETISSLDEAVSRGEFDFVLTNPSSYVEHEVRYGVQRLLTLENKHLGRGYTEFGAVIFTRADRDDINSLEDLKGKRFMAVSEQAFGGWQVAWRELLDHGIDPYRDFKQLSWGGGHQPNVVLGVLTRRVDAGTVRTDLLERLAADGLLQLEQIKVLNQQDASHFPLLRSTRLYPEWPFAKLPHTDNRLAQQVARALLSMPQDDPAAIAGRYVGWHTPLDHKPVHKLLKLLGAPPYDHSDQLSPLYVAYHYWPWALGILMGLLIGLSVIIRMRLLNAKLKATQEQLHRMARHDSLTGLANRYRLEEFLQQEWGQAIRGQRPVSAVLFDLDSFKEYNDQYGHVAGDDCLRKVALVANGLFRRAGELVVRYGGEEFLIVLIDTPPEQAAASAESLRQRIEQLHLPHSLSPISQYVTISAGIATLVPGRSDTPEHLIQAADKALYLAKQNGRNRAVVAET